MVVNNDNNQTTTFAYDASGLRTKTVEPGNKTTYAPFPGVEEEVVGGTTTRRVTYSLGGQAIALRVQIVGGPNTLYYLHTDHLGSTRLLSDSNGDPVPGSTTRYYPFGDWRTEPTANLTDRGYTGHQHNNTTTNDLSLIYMNARYYLPGIARFASADTIVPNVANPQALNRYSYVYNNPLAFVDPSGHRTCTPQQAATGDETCDQNNSSGNNSGNNGTGNSSNLRDSLLEGGNASTGGTTGAFTSVFNNAFPYFFFHYLHLATTAGIQGGDGQFLEGQALYNTIYQMAYHDTMMWLSDFLSDDNNLSQAMRGAFGQRPSDVLGRGVALTAQFGYMATAQAIANMVAILGSTTPVGSPCSFSADTSVSTIDGLQPIEL